MPWELIRSKAPQTLFQISWLTSRGQWWFVGTRSLFVMLLHYFFLDIWILLWISLLLYSTAHGKPISLPMFSCVNRNWKLTRQLQLLKVELDKVGNLSSALRSPAVPPVGMFTWWMDKPCYHLIFIMGLQLDNKALILLVGFSRWSYYCNVNVSQQPWSWESLSALIHKLEIRIIK